jgi:hypothetical protein
LLHTTTMIKFVLQLEEYLAFQLRMALHIHHGKIFSIKNNCATLILHKTCLIEPNNYFNFRISFKFFKNYTF